MTTDVKDVKAEMISIIAEQAMMDEGDIKMESTLNDIGLDSLGVVEAVFAIEERFDVQIPFNANDPSESKFDVSTVGSMIAAVEGLVAERG